MLVSPAEREELIRRVSRQVRGRAVEAALVRSAVDRVVAMLASRDEQARVVAPVVVVTAESMPDLASRLRSALGSTDLLQDVAVATEGRHTVLVARSNDSQLDTVRAAAERIGARFVRRGQA
ncbi:MAG: hypothetical protein ACT4P7_00520 [Gemmatimonadaceae bacterium]